MADEPNLVKLKVNGELFEVDMDDLELGEIGVVEDLCGKSIQEIDLSSARGLQGLVWLAMHRKNPMVSVEDAGRVKIGAFEDPEPVENGTAPKGKAKRPTKAA